MNLKRPAVDDTVKQKLPVRRIAEKTGIGSAIAGGTAASIIGFVAAGSSATAAISAVGAAGVVGSGIGLVTGGIGIAATAPFAVAGAAMGGWAGPALALIGIGTAPLWAVPLAVSVRWAELLPSCTNLASLALQKKMPSPSIEALPKSPGVSVVLPNNHWLASDACVSPAD